MKILKTQNYQDMSRKAANIISAQIILNSESVLGLATGSSPIGVYEQLIDWNRKGDVDFSHIKTVNLDEYQGLQKSDEQSYYYFMHKRLFEHVNIRLENTHIPNGMEKDAKKECAHYEEMIKSLGGVDLQLLGLGHNGHIGFNEPADVFEEVTHCVELTQNTIDVNKRFFSSEEAVPKKAYTMGIGTIMRAKQIVLIVSGEDKADILKKVIEGPVTPKVPASILKFHPYVTIVADKAALSLCNKQY